MHHFTQAICRLPARNAGDGLTTARLGTPDFEKLLEQHAAYVMTLESLGIQVALLPELPGFPDAYFVEDAAVVLPTFAIIARSGADARRGEESSIKAALDPFRESFPIEAPATLDGGDVLATDSEFFVGISKRTNQAGAKQLAAMVENVGFRCTSVPLPDGLHLKSSVNYLGGKHLAVTKSFSNSRELQNFNILVVPPDEEYAANTLLVNNHLITPVGFPKTRKLLEQTGLPIIELDCSEFQKMDGGLSCLSLRF